MYLLLLPVRFTLIHILLPISNAYCYKTTLTTWEVRVFLILFIHEYIELPCVFVTEQLDLLGKTEKDAFYSYIYTSWITSCVSVRSQNYMCTCKFVYRYAPNRIQLLNLSESAINRHHHGIHLNVKMYAVQLNTHIAVCRGVPDIDFT